MASGWVFLTPEQLKRALRQRSIADAQIERALVALSGPDPAGAIASVSWEEVACVAAYLHVWLGGAWVANPFWRLIEQGHQAARAIYWHELRELEGYRLLGIRNPLRLRPRSAAYRQAHARACWDEALYWEAWARAEGEEISAAAFLHAHPLRRSAELARVLGEMELSWGIDVESPPVLVLRRASHFYRSKQLTAQAIET